MFWSPLVYVWGYKQGLKNKQHATKIWSKCYHTCLQRCPLSKGRWLLPMPYLKWEIIIINDGSTDETAAILEELCENNPKLKLVHQHVNMGVSVARNLGLKAASMPFIAFLDADDVYLSNRFIKTAETFANDDQCGWVYESCKIIFENKELEKAFIKEDILFRTNLISYLVSALIFYQSCNPKQSCFAAQWHHLEKTYGCRSLFILMLIYDRPGYWFYMAVGFEQ